MNALLSLAISVASFIALYNYLPLDLVTFNTHTPSFGATITTIQGSDTLSASRSVINTNFANLNSDKIENSTTSVKSITTLSSLASIGTITTGVWNGTAITVPYGGTGSTTLGSNLILLGNGTGNVKTVTGLGNSGQVLMSNGAGSAPSWNSSSVDTTQPYSWTNHHIFTSLFSALASTTNATTTNLTVSGNAIFTNEQWNEKLYLDPTTTAIAASSASNTIASFSVPANTLSTNNAIECHFSAGFDVDNGTWLAYEFAYGNATTSDIVFYNSGNTFRSSVDFRFFVGADGATNDQQVTTNFFTSTTTRRVSTAGAVDSTTAKQITFVVRLQDTSLDLFSGDFYCSLIR